MSLATYPSQPSSTDSADEAKIDIDEFVKGWVFWVKLLCCEYVKDV